jgi:hypothetical protein
MVALSVSQRIDFYYLGEAADTLERLRRLPDNAGPERVRAEFG